LPAEAKSHRRAASDIESSQEAAKGDGLNLEVELATQRYRLARKLYYEDKFEEAIPHFRKSLDAFLQLNWSRQKVQLYLAISIFEIYRTEPKLISTTTGLLPEARTILQELVEDDSYDSHDTVRYTLAHVQCAMGTDDDLSEAKRNCHQLIKNATRSGKKKETKELFGLMIRICEKSHDADGDVWREILRSMEQLASEPIQILDPRTEEASGVVPSDSRMSLSHAPSVRMQKDAISSPPPYPRRPPIGSTFGSLEFGAGNPSNRLPHEARRRTLPPPASPARPRLPLNRSPRSGFTDRMRCFLIGRPENTPERRV
jgi:hypothetical protein